MRPLEDVRRYELKQVAGLRYSLEQADAAIEKAIAFVQARKVGEISYGRKSGGCVITHPNFRERWLKVKWELAGKLDRTVWDGELLSIGIEGVSKPRIFGHFDWDAIGLCYRALTMSIASGILATEGHHLDCMPALDARWWQQLADAVATIGAKVTDRVCVDERVMALQLEQRFGIRLKRPFPHWQTAHGDLHWANLTAPELSILDWETWGRAPYGFDVAHLYLFSVTQAEALANLKQVFSPILENPAYDLTLLYAAADLIRQFESRGKHEAIQEGLHREVETVLERRRYAQYCA